MTFRGWLLLIGIGLCPVGAAAQTPEVNIGEPVQLAFDESTTKPQEGWTIVYRAYVDGQAVDAVSGPYSGRPGSRIFALPAFAAAGSKTLTVSATPQIDDPARWRCGGNFSTSGGTIVCGEVMSEPLALSVVAPPIPPVDPPTNLRIIRTTTVSEVTIDAQGVVLETTSRTVVDVIKKQ